MRSVGSHSGSGTPPRGCLIKRVLVNFPPWKYALTISPVIIITFLVAILGLHLYASMYDDIYGGVCVTYEDGAECEPRG